MSKHIFRRFEVLNIPTDGTYVIEEWAQCKTLDFETEEEAKQHSLEGSTCQKDNTSLITGITYCKK